MNHRHLSIAAVLLACLSIQSCMSFSEGELKEVRQAITRQVPELALKKEFAVSVGAGMFHFLDAVTFNEADLSELDRVRVAVYSVQDRPGVADKMKHVDMERSLRESRPGLDWQTFIRVRDEDELVWVLAGMNLDRNSLEEMSVIVWERGELVLIDMDGDLEQLMEVAMGPARQARHREKREIL